MSESLEYTGIVTLLEPQLKQFKSEMQTLNSSLENLNKINQNLSIFNKNFAKYMQGLLLYSKTVKFPEAPNESTVELLMRPKTPPRPESPEISISESGEFFQTEPEIAKTPTLFKSPSVRPSNSQADTLTRNNSRIKAEASGIHSTTLANRRKKHIFNPRKMIDTLPSKYRIQPHKSIIESILKDLFHEPEGFYIHDIMRATGGVLSKKRYARESSLLNFSA
ncbi:hypothetical protein BB561_002736 [Smittium simulii]|uniref:Uncharacterized protein n=1 Tax=Smittium simulii TaxID=133385 RepID=A0A2T9YPH6_9FUNG|nr:hypothetical protein BB561_002736 [Smittium simulii]